VCGGDFPEQGIRIAADGMHYIRPLVDDEAIRQKSRDWMHEAILNMMESFSQHEP
jgi:hypothetical protein